MRAPEVVHQPMYACIHHGGQAVVHGTQNQDKEREEDEIVRQLLAWRHYIEARRDFVPVVEEMRFVLQIG